ncbi:MAG: alpha/beta fold hydrolase [Gammaproteobacteria bacterium]
MATFILIHGAWHGGWCWERIVPLLEKQGHRVLAPDLPGMGKDHTPLAEITLDRWAQFVADLIAQQDEKVILVGHSRGGIVISQAAEYAAKHIQGLIYLAGFLIPNGETSMETLQRHPPGPERPIDFVFSSDQSTATVTAESVRENFYNTTSDIWIERAKSQLGAEPMISYKTPLRLTEAGFGQVPRAYIECLQDRAIPISLQRSMLSALPCEHVVTLDTDHSPFYSAPEILVSQLTELATLFWEMNNQNIEDDYSSLSITPRR